MSGSSAITAVRLDRWVMAVPEAAYQATHAAPGAAVDRGTEVETLRPGSPPPAELIGLTERMPLQEAVFGTLRGRAVSVPTTWEREGFPKTLEGPVWFAIRVPDGVEGTGWTLRLEAASYHVVVWLDGKSMGSHRGMWDPFEISLDRVDRGAMLAIEVFKPGTVFPVQESLAGFIPYVTCTFGGLWQEASLIRRGGLHIEDLWVRTDGTGSPAVLVRLWSEVARDLVTLTITCGDSQDARTLSLPPGPTEVDFVLSRPDLPIWSPQEPNLVNVLATATSGGLVTSMQVKTGMRTVSVDGAAILLNNRPIYPRGVLHWMAYPDLFAPTPSSDTIREEFARIRDLGYTMVKLCLVIPPEEYFTLADEAGILLWVEMPMWLPHIGPNYLAQAAAEYRRILRRIRNHPSVLMYTVGCELSSEADASLLRSLYDLIKEETGCPLVRDNSGSAEAYGGVDAEFADYHDYHFYAEANEFTDLLDYFLPWWKPIKPLVFGEYCDSDTFRSVDAISRALGRTPYWALADPVENPQGVRWEYNIVHNSSRLQELDLGIPFEEVTARSYRRSLEYRKSIIEQTRSHPAASGYVVTNIQDTPITTSGMLDDLGLPKFDGESFRRFNSDSVLTLARDRRRLWIRGGDRRQFLDECCALPGRPLRLHVLLSHVGDRLSRLRLRHEFRVVGATGPSLGEGETSVPGTLGPIGRLRLTTLSVDVPATATGAELVVGVTLSGELESGVRRVIAQNEFSYWILPVEPMESTRPLLVYDPIGELREGLRGRESVSYLADLSDAADAFASAPRPVVSEAGTEVPILISTVADPRLGDYARSGGRLLVILQDGAQPFCEGEPFFREAIPLVHDHPLVAGLPHHGYAGVAFAGVAPDRTMAPAALRSLFGSKPVPAISRLDARRFVVGHYLSTLAPWDENRATVVATSLRLTGGFGRSPKGFRENLLGRYLFETAVGYLAGGG